MILFVNMMLLYRVACQHGVVNLGSANSVQVDLWIWLLLLHACKVAVQWTFSITAGLELRRVVARRSKTRLPLPSHAHSSLVDVVLVLTGSQ
jgi:hypothetical protein